MTKLVFGTTNLKEFEVLECIKIGGGIEKFRNKKVAAKELLEVLENLGDIEEKELFNINVFDTFNTGLISHKKTNRQEILVFNFKEQMIRTFYNGKYHKIVHCNAFIKIHVKGDIIQDMYIYPYKKYKGRKTELFDNPYPNRFSSNKTCLGTADRRIRGNYTETILSLLEVEYTSATMYFKDKKLNNTYTTFDYLEKNKFPYDELVANKKTLKDII